MSGSSKNSSFSDVICLPLFFSPEPVGITHLRGHLKVRTELFKGQTRKIPEVPQKRKGPAYARPFKGKRRKG
jgi:hypothetical protein